MKSLLYKIIFLFYINSVFAIDLQVNVTNETCPGTGNLQFIVTNTIPNQPVTYFVYLIPNTTTPVVTTNETSINVQEPGTYLIVASQTVNGVTTSAQQTVSVTSSYIEPVITLTGTPEVCGNDGTITVSVASGTVVGYQILASPPNNNYQNSNVFSGLSAGNYIIRVIDICGQTTISGFNLPEVPVNLVIEDAIPVSTELLTCTTISVTHNISGINGVVGIEPIFPLTIQTTFVNPLGGTTVTNQTINSGSTFNLTVPISNDNFNVSFPYSIIVTTACGTQFTKTGITYSFPFDASVLVAKSDCTNYAATFGLTHYKPPFNLNFLSAPAGFNPIISNSNHPGPHTGDSVTYSNMPQGVYAVQITDFCGDTKLVNFTVELSNQNAEQITEIDGCTGFGDFTVYVVNPNVDLVSATIISGPSGQSYPIDVSSFIDASSVQVVNVPVGTYVVEVEDICGNVVTETVNFPPPTPESPTSSIRVGCEVGQGGIQYLLGTSQFTLVEIVAAPAAFTETLPYNASSFITPAGDFSITNLPGGQYSFHLVTNCGYDQVVQANLIAYTVTSTTIETPVEVCSGFNLQFNHISNSSFAFYLQKYNPNDDIWEHPQTGIDYNPSGPAPNNVPNINNSILVNNNVLNQNIFGDSGLYRILKVHLSFQSSSTNLSRCFTEIGQFVFEGGPKFIAAYTFPCANNTQEVVVVAQGLEPLQYRIVEKDNLPFLVNNGSQNNFSNLTPGLYKFEFEDSCGFIRTRIIDITTLDSPQITPVDLCPGENGSLQTQGFSFITYQWFKETDPSTILSTTNVLNFTNFNPATDAGIYKVSLSSTNANSCANQILTYEIKLSDYTPSAGNDANPSYCKTNQTIDLNSLLSASHDAGGVWTNQANEVLSNTLINPQDLPVGNSVYTYTVSSVLCSLTDAAVITVNVKAVPAAPAIQVPTTICRLNPVQLSTNLVSGATYNWTGPNGFSSNLQNPTIASFTSVNDGQYSLFITINGCDSPATQVNVQSNPIPDFTIDGSLLFCETQSSQLVVNPTNFVLSNATFKWFFDDVELIGETQGTLTASQFGIYKVEVNLGGCINTKEVTTALDTNAFQVNLTQGCLGTSYFISIANPQDFPNAIYSWSGPNGYTSNEQNINITNSGVGDYTVLVTNEDGCEQSESVTVTRVACFIPSGLSPNDDGVNDFLDLAGYNVKKLTIFNRWGKIVYEKEGYVNEWKGQSNQGDLLPATTYFYTIEYEVEEGNKKNGWIYISY